MKRVKAACILQTLVFSQNPDAGYTRDQQLSLNRDEVKHYQVMLEKAKTRYQLIDQQEQEDGSIIVHVRKQYNYKADVSEYFQ